jgi:hypothetical protein
MIRVAYSVCSPLGIFASWFCECMATLTQDERELLHRAVAEWSDFWEAHPPIENVDAEAGITLFTRAGNPEKDLLSVIDTIELHHGLASHGPKVNALRILGAQPTDAVREAIAPLGFTRIELITGGFMAHWQEGDGKCLPCWPQRGGSEPFSGRCRSAGRYVS